MIAWAVEIIIYAALAIGATWASRRHAVAIIGLTLILCSAVTNVSYFGSTFASRLTLEAIQAVTVINSARLAFNAGSGIAAIGTVALSIIDLAFVVLIAFGYANPRAPGLIGNIYGDVTNAIFAVQCFLVAAPGVRDAILGRAAGRLPRRAMGGRGPAVYDRDVAGPRS